MPTPLFQKGRAKTGGKVKGTKNKATILRERAEAEAHIKLSQAKLASREEIENAMARMHTTGPLEVLLCGMHLRWARGDVEGASQLATAAVPFTSPKLTASEVTVRVQERSDAEISSELEALRQKIERSRSLPAVTIEGSAQPVEVAAEPVQAQTTDVVKE